MQSLPMNEFIQQNLKDVGIEVEFKVVELEVLYTRWRKGAKDEMNADVTANNVAYVTSDPLYAIIRFFHSSQVAPVGVNWGTWSSPAVDALLDEAAKSFDVAKQDELLAKVHSLIVDDAVLGLGGARHQPACAVAEGQEVRAGPALVPGPDDDRRRLNASAARRASALRRAARDAVDQERHREADDEEAHQVVRADIERVEPHREGEHRHGL